MNCIAAINNQIEARKQQQEAAEANAKAKWEADLVGWKNLMAKLTEDCHEIGLLHLIKSNEPSKYPDTIGLPTMYGSFETDAGKMYVEIQIGDNSKKSAASLCPWVTGTSYEIAMSKALKGTLTFVGITYLTAQALHDGIVLLAAAVLTSKGDELGPIDHNSRVDKRLLDDKFVGFPEPAPGGYDKPKPDALREQSPEPATQPTA
jgi:hypothetical protein